VRVAGSGPPCGTSGRARTWRKRFLGSRIRSRRCRNSIRQRLRKKTSATLRRTCSRSRPNANALPFVLYRFARDLRLEDHAGLAEAARHGEIVPVLVIDPLLRRRVTASPRRAAFFLRAVHALDDALRERGSRLVVKHGSLAQTIPALAAQTQAQAVVWSASYDAAAMREESQLRLLLEERGLRVEIVHDGPVIPPDETSQAKASRGQGYRALAPYIETWRSLEVTSHEAPLLCRFASKTPAGEALPAAQDFDAAAPPDDATPNGAAQSLTRFLKQDALQYSVAVSVPSDDRTSHLCAHLSFGTIAARTVVRETKRRAEDPFLLAEERASLRRFLRSLAQRDFFLQLSWCNPQTQTEALQPKMRKFPLARTHEHLEAWQHGKTGFPLIDAGIRQLHATGWMHPYVRSIAASFLCFDLGIDWRVGLGEWERHLIEDDPALAAGNWQWVAGVGADLAAYPRIYNPLKGARRFDPTGAYARAWIAELAHGSSRRAGGRAPQLTLPLFGSKAYPAPILDHGRAAREYLARYNLFVGANSPATARPANR